MLCKQFNLDPLADGVILSHKEGCARGIASNHDDPEHLWNQLGMNYTMNTFRAAVKAAMGGSMVAGLLNYRHRQGHCGPNKGLYSGQKQQGSQFGVGHDPPVSV